MGEDRIELTQDVGVGHLNTPALCEETRAQSGEGGERTGFSFRV
jgi:hypothetical protein